MYTIVTTDPTYESLTVKMTQPREMRAIEKAIEIAKLMKAHLYTKRVKITL